MRWKDRSRAAGVHLLASVGVALLAAVLVFQVWYPYPYGELAGGSGLFRLLVSVDVVMGPLLTLIVFNRDKSAKELWRDLSVIVVLQLAALGYGLHTVYQARPVYLVHEVDRFRVVTAPDIDPADLPLAAENFRELPRFGVRVIGVRPPRDPAENIKSLELALAGKDISLQPQRWQELDDANRDEIRRRSRDLTFLRGRAKDGAQALDQLVAASGVPSEQIIGLPMMGRRDDWSAIMDRRDLHILGYLPIDAF